MKSVRHWTQLAVLWFVVLAFVFSPASVGVKADDGDDGGGFRHVFVIMMENTGFNTLIGNPNAPFTNYLAATAGLASNYFGVTHPSQPNYIAATSGSTNGATGDGSISYLSGTIIATIAEALRDDIGFDKFGKVSLGCGLRWKKQPYYHALGALRRFAANIATRRLIKLGLKVFTRVMWGHLL